MESHFKTNSSIVSQWAYNELTHVQIVLIANGESHTLSKMCAQRPPYYGG